MNVYFVVVVGGVVAFAAVVTISLMVAVIKGIQAGETVVELQIAGFIRFSIRLSNISGKRIRATNKEGKN